MMNKPASLAASALILTLFLVSCAAPTTAPHRYALVYGVSYYGSSKNLAFPALDADSVAQMLLDKGFDSVTERTSAADTREYLNAYLGGAATPGAGPTKANIQADVAAAAAAIGPNDLFVFYFSGHGAQTGLANGDTREWIVPLGGSNPYLVPSASIYEEELAEMLDSVPSPRKVVILDSCNSGGFAGTELEVDRTMPNDIYSSPIITPAVIAAAITTYFDFPSSTNGGVSPYGNALVIAGCGKDEETYDAPAYTHGALTYFFLEIRDHGDLNGDGAVTVMEAFSLTKAGIDQVWNKDPTERFMPRISGGPIDYVLW